MEFTAASRQWGRSGRGAAIGGCSGPYPLQGDAKTCPCRPIVVVTRAGKLAIQRSSFLPGFLPGPISFVASPLFCFPVRGVDNLSCSVVMQTNES